VKSNQLICEIQWDRVPLVYSQKDARTWLGFQAGRGLALNTLDACGRNLERYLRFLNKCNKQPHEITQEVVGAYLRDLVKAVLPYSVPLESLLKRRQVFSCLARRVFGFKRFAAAEKKVKARLRELGYHHRTL
jgi:site-specific recombinase XerD